MQKHHRCAARDQAASHRADQACHRLAGVDRVEHHAGFPPGQPHRLQGRRRGLAVAGSDLVVGKTRKSAADTGDSPFFQALNDAGFIGCIETDEQLSTTYKSQLDFSTKIETRP